MKFSTTHEYPTGIDRLWAAFGRPEYPRQKYLALGATAVRLDRFDADAQTIKVSLERVVPITEARMPAWARYLLGHEQTLRHHTVWRRVLRCRVDVRLEIIPVGLPVQARGTGSIVELPAGASRMTLSWQIDSSLPMLGRRVERLFAEQVRTALDEDHRFSVGFLRQPTPAQAGAPTQRPGQDPRR